MAHFFALLARGRFCRAVAPTTIESRATSSILLAAPNAAAEAASQDADSKRKPRIAAGGGISASRETTDGGSTTSKKIDKFELLLPQLTLFGAVPAGNGIRILLELTRILLPSSTD